MDKRKRSTLIMAKSFSLNTLSNITNKMTFDTFNKKVEKATNSLKSTPDWNAILEICDSVRHKDVTPKYALGVIKKKLYSRSAHQVFFTLLTLESMVKNCGPPIHEEVATVSFCEMLHERLQTTQDQQIRHKILDMLQTWAYAFRDLPQYRPVHDIVMYLKKTGYRFPPLNVSDAMFTTHVAPRFVDGDVCYKCNMAFSILSRRHHCRGCGQPFCQACSTNTSILPRFGIEKPVRVCDNCYKNYGLPSLKRGPHSNVEAKKSLDFLLEDSVKPKSKASQEIQEEEELQLAIALSKSEAEHKEKQRRARMQIAFTPSANTTSKPSPKAASSKAPVESPEMSHYLNRSYWEKRAASSTASAPESVAGPAPSTSLKSAPESKESKQRTKKSNSLDDPEDKEIDEFVETLQTQIEIFVNRMKSDASRGRPIVNDTAVQSLFLNLTAMHTHLIGHIRQLDDKRTYLESLQNKVIEVREYRTALDLLRAEHAAQMATAQEVAEIRRQMELAVKLDALRKSKNNYLQYQRHIAFQKVQEEEREFQQGRHDMQKLPYMRSAHSGTHGRYPNTAVPSNTQFVPSISPGKSDAGIPQQIPNLNSIRIIPQNLLSQTRVQTISINQNKGKQLNQPRPPPPQAAGQDTKNNQERPINMNRESPIVNRTSQQQINQMYQNNPNYGKPLLAQQHNYINLVPNQMQDQNLNQYQRQSNEVNPMFLPQYPSIIQQVTGQKQQHNLMQSQTLNNQQYYPQNTQYYPQNTPTNNQAQGNLQNQIKIQNDVINQAQNLNNQTQNPLPPTQTQNICPNFIPNLNQNNQNPLCTMPPSQTQNQNTQHLPTQNAIHNHSVQNHIPQNTLPATQNINNTQNINTHNLSAVAQNQQIQGQTQNAVPPSQTQNVIPPSQAQSTVQNHVPNINMTHPLSQNPIQNNQHQNTLIPPQNQQTQNIYQPLIPQNLVHNAQAQNNQNTQNVAQNMPALVTQGPVQTIQYGQSRVQMNNNEYQEQTDKPDGKS